MPGRRFPALTPSIYYDDANAAIDWLADAFGFELLVKVPGDEGRVVHSELRLGDAWIMVASPTPGGSRQGPRTLGGKTTMGLFVYVDDVDAHCERARAAGATILREPADSFNGDRVYGCADLQGHEWFFATHVTDDYPEDA